MKRQVTRLPFSEIRLLVGTVVLLLGFAWTLVTAAVLSERNANLMEARREIEALNRITAEQVLRAITAVDYTVGYTAGALAGSSRPGVLGDLVDRGTIRLDTLVLLSHVDASGRLLETNRGVPAKTVELADREHIRVHLDRQIEGLFIGKPVKGRESGKWSIQLTRAIQGSDGSVRGVVVASMDPHYFARFWQSGPLSKGYRYKLVGLDGVVRASSTDTEQLLSQGAVHPALAEAAWIHDAGYLPAASIGLDEGSHLVRFQRIEGLPLALVTSREIGALGSYFSWTSRQYILIGLVATIALLIVTQQLLRRTTQLFAERKDALTARQRLRDAIDAIPEGFALFDVDDRLVICNAAYKRVYATSADIIHEGVTFEQIIRAGVERGQYPQATGRVDAWVADRLTRHRNPGGPFEQITDTGRWLRIEERRTEDGGIVGIRADITAIKERELDLAQQTALLTATFEHMSEGLTVIDAAGRIVAFNRRFAELSNAPEKADIAGTQLAQLLAIFGQSDHVLPEPLIGDGEVALNESILHPGKAVEWHAPDNRVIELKSSRLPDGGVVTVYNDVTESRAYAHRVAASEALKSAMIAASLDGIVMVNNRGIVTEYNGAAETILGWQPSEAVGRPIVDLLFRGDEHEELVNLLNSGTAWEKDILRPRCLETRVLHKDGHSLLSEITISAIKAGGRSSFSVFIRDISERKRIEEETRRAREAAEEANRSKSEFLAIVSHEVRTPMDGIIGLTSLLMRTQLDREQLQFARGIQESSERLLILTNEILEFSRLEAGRLQTTPAPFDLPHLVNGLVVTTRVLVGAKHVDVRLDLSDDVPTWLEGDATRLHQVMHNLLANASKFTEAGTIALCIRALEKDDHSARLRVEIRDTGPGISPEVQSRLFTPFEQGSSSVARRYGGTGLGLAISRRLIDLMGGRIGCDSVVGIGTTFWFEVTLPLAEAPQREDEKPFASIMPVGRTLDVLVAEDTPTSQLVIRSMLMKLGHRPRIVADGVEAVAAMRLGRYDLVLMDLQMPNMDGIEATREIRALASGASQTPIIALTAQADVATRERIAAAGMNEHLSKPITIERLEAMLASLDTGPAAVTGNPPDSPTSGEIGAEGVDQPLLDEAVFASLRDAVGEEAFGHLVSELLADAEDALDSLARGLEAGDEPGLVRTAHKLSGIFGQFGLTAAARLATAVETAENSGIRVQLGHDLLCVGQASMEAPQLRPRAA